MTVKTIVNKFRKHNPKSLEDILRLCVPSLSYINRGSFRCVYKVDKLPLVVKIVTENTEDESLYSECLEHHENELDAINRVKRYKKYETIRKYVPTIYYHNKSGIILMAEYKQPSIKDNSKLCETAAEEISTVYGKQFDTWKNFTQDDKGRVILLDWGILGQKSAWIEVETGS